MKKIIKIIKVILFFPFFFIEVFAFKIFNKKNSEKSYQYLIHYFSIFGGGLNKFLGKFLSRKKINIKSNFKKTIILNKDKIKINEELNNDGYSINSYGLAIEKVEEINNYLKNLKGTYVSDHIEKNNEKEFFDLEKPKGVKFYYDSNELIKFKLIQDLAFDREILSIAQDYLGSLPLLDIVTAWWSVPSKNPDKKAAQLWHFDMDRPTWLKVFFYLTDCEDDNGPHCFVSGTHLKRKIPIKLRSKGYERLKDEEINKIFNKDMIKKFVTKKGTILFEDTSGLHKGLTLKSGSRLILQFQYSSSLFGGSSLKLNLPKNMTENFSYVHKEHVKLLEIFK